MFYSKSLVSPHCTLLVIAAFSFAVSCTAPSAERLESQSTPSLQKSSRYTEVPTQQPQQTKTGMQPEPPVISPNQMYAVASELYDPYAASSEPQVFVVLNAMTGETLRRIPVYWAARFVASVEWIDNRFVSVRGEAGFLAVLDVDAGEQTHNLLGENFTISPDGAQIVFSHDFNPRYGYVPPEYDSDYVLFSLVRRPPISGAITDKYSFFNDKVIYPDSLAWNQRVRKANVNLDDRHQIKSSFAWSDDSRKVAFVETHQKKSWLVVLQPTIRGEDVIPVSQKIEIEMLAESTVSLSWVSDSNLIKVEDSQTALVVDLETKTVKAVPSIK